MIRFDGLKRKREPLRVGVIGAGVMGCYHTQTLMSSVSGADVVAVSSLAAPEGWLLTHNNGLELINDPQVQAVIVASPDETHEEFVLACLQVGKPVLCEKPLAPTGEACDRIVKAEVAAGQRLVQVGYMRRFDPAYGALKAVLDEGLIGKPLVLHCAHRAPGPSRNRTTEMMISNAAVHDFDAVRWLIGEEIVTAAVHLPSSRRAARGQFDPLMIVLRTASEIVVEVEIFVNAGYGCEIRAEVVCESGTVELAPSPLALVKYHGNERLAVAQSTFTRFGEAYRMELQAWVDAVSTGQVVRPDAWDGYAATSVADACRESVTTGQPVDVHLDTRPALYS
jgi:myo-inositol 2-dehydrogenase/D-chiro-inositol 1-dehydrogenase